ncbi:MAG: alpha/beta fold hydrolase [Nanoarchaeota archaeon]
MRKEVIFTGSKGEKIRAFEWSGKKATIIFAHGYNGRKEDWEEWPEILAEKGYRVITFDFPPPHELKHNVEILESILNKIKGKVGLVGYSLGGTAAINIAAKNKNITCLVTFVAPHAYFTNETGKHNIQINTLDKAKLVKCPWLMFYATEDSVVPFKQGKDLFAVANEPKKFVALKGVDHDLDIETANQSLIEMTKWFGRYLGGKNGKKKRT